MKIGLVIRVFPAICFAITSALAVSLSKPNCEEKCGKVTIPYPFGIGSKCSANSSFTVTCQNSTIPPKPFLSSINVEILHISLHGAVIVNLPVSPMKCFDEARTESLPISLKGGPFFISAHYNSMVVMGCKNLVWSTTGGCTASCDADSTDNSCNGVNCCRASIPRRLQELHYTYQSIQHSNTSFCGYVFPAEMIWLQDKAYKRYKGLVTDPSNPFDREFGFAPLVLEWEFGNEGNFSTSYCTRPHELSPIIRNLYLNYGYAFPHSCVSLLDHFERECSYSVYYDTVPDYMSSTRYCTCPPQYEGNPYIVEGCFSIIDSFDTSVYYEDENDGFRASKNDGFRASIKITSIVVGSVVGVLILLTAAWKFGKAVTETVKAIKASRKYMFFKRNGGILLEQQLAAIENGIEKTRLFSSVELAKATDDYNENRVLGRGGEGVVYKGMLEDGRIVAVKKSERVGQGDVEDFINEVVTVSQINHRNVVKLLGCCLESEVPRLVYEYIPNGTLFSHIHHPQEDFPLFWELRVRIAKQVAGALAYLHSAASVPIYHRDIKSTNILLDEIYRAKISDFGTSRSISLDQTHVTTRVVGTFGYLDPEYFQSSQFTEKSDVYSFGVVLVELLTGEKAISAVRVEEGRGLAMHFLHSMEEDQLFEIVDARVLREGKREEIMAMAEIAKRCLHLNGKGRPTMKEVSHHLDAIQVEIPQNKIQSSGCNSVDSDDGLSEVSESPSSDEC